jgi:hypothetical protein
LNVTTGGTNRLNVNSSGNVGIGTSTPDHRLTISGGPTWTSNSWAGAISLSHGSAIGWEGNSSGQRAGIGHTDGGLYFFRTASDPGATGSPANYDMYISDSGNVGIGTNPTNARLQVDGGSNSTGVIGTSSGSGLGVYGSSQNYRGVFGFSPEGIGVYGQSLNYYAGYFNGNVGVSGCLSASNLSCPSDARLKRDITPLSYGLPEVLRLRPVTWQWKDATKTEPNLGLVAQDVEPVLPELILHNADNKGALGLNYMGLIPVLIKGMQEQQAQIEAQQEQNREQQEQNRKLEERLAALEKLLSTIQPSTTDR